MAARVVADRGISDLDDEENVPSGEFLQPFLSIEENDVGLEERVLGQAEGRLWSDLYVVGRRSIPAAEQGYLQKLVAVSLWRHRHDLPADELATLVLRHQPGRDHRLDVGHGEASPRQALGGLRRSRSGMHGHGHLDVSKRVSRNLPRNDSLRQGITDCDRA